MLRLSIWVADHWASLVYLTVAAVIVHGSRSGGHEARCELARDWALQCTNKEWRHGIFACEEEAKLIYRCTDWPASWSGR